MKANVYTTYNEGYENVDVVLLDSYVRIDSITISSWHRRYIPYTSILEINVLQEEGTVAYQQGGFDGPSPNKD